MVLVKIALRTSGCMDRRTEAILQYVLALYTPSFLQKKGKINCVPKSVRGLSVCASVRHVIGQRSSQGKGQIMHFLVNASSP